MQATLLGISVAIILALLAALVGPFFVDWSQFRAQFETEATKVAGAPVRIAGPIDVRILPTPTLTLGGIEIGSAAQPQAKARELYVELALGSLVRGSFRASDLRLVGPEVSFGLSGNGRLDWPVARVGFDPDQLQIDKFAIEDGRVDFTDAANGAHAALEGFWFKGDLRSLLGPVKGEGGFTSANERYAYRVSAGRVGNDGSMKVKIGIDPSDQPLAIEADGALRLDDNSPRFDGTLALARPATMARGEGRGGLAVPWRMTSKVRATSAQAVFEQLEYQYGPDERATKLSGTAELRLGKSPRFESTLTGRQVDLDRALALPDAAGRLPLAALKAFAESFTSSYRPQIPVRLGIGVDAVTLAGGTLQSVRGDLRLDGDAWTIETFEFRAPGFAQIKLSGRMGRAGDGVAFKGPVQIEATNPRAFIAWLEGRADAPQAQAGTLRAGGELTVGAQKFAVDRLKFEFDRKTIEGRIAYAAADGGAPPRLDGDLKAAELDVDGVLAFVRTALDGSAIERPRVVSLSVDIGRANIAGIDVKGVSGTFKLDPDGLTFDRVRIADLADAAFSLNGRMEGALDAPRGTVTFDVDARGLDGTAAVLEKYFPQAAGPVRQAAAKITPLKTHATLGIEPLSSTDPRGNSKLKLALDGSAGTLRVKLGVEAAGDVGALTLPDFQLDGQVSAADGSALISLLGLDRAITVDKRNGALSVTMRGASGADPQLDARLTAGGLAASAKGTARLFSRDGVAAALDLTLQAADAGGLRRGAAAQSGATLPVALRAKLGASANEVTLDGIWGLVARAPIRGRLKFGLGNEKTVEGQIDAESADASALIALLAGMPATAPKDSKWPVEPFGESAFDGYRGSVVLSAARAGLTPSLTGRDVRGVLRFGAGELAIEDITGTFARGTATGQLVLRRGADGLQARAKLTLAGADAAGLVPGEGKPAISGRFGLEAEVQGSGLSPASLIGSLTGAGTLTLEDAQIAGLDPKAFNAAMLAVDQGTAADAAKVRDIVTTVLDGGPLAIPRLDAAVTVNAGQARVSQTIAYGQGADLSFAGGADLAEGSLDGRLTLSGPTVGEGTSATRPEILLTLKGPFAVPKRTVDVSALSGWLMLRSVERQSKRIDAIETERRAAERREAERREAERRELEARGVTAPTALPAPAILDEAPTGTPQPPARIIRPRPAVPSVRPQAPAVDRAPALPPPLNIGPAPGASGKSSQAPQSAAAPARSAQQQLPLQQPASRSALDVLFGVQR